MIRSVASAAVRTAGARVRGSPLRTRGGLRAAAAGLALLVCGGGCATSLPTDAQIETASPAGLQTIELKLRDMAKDNPDNPRIQLQFARALLRRGALAEAEVAALQADQQAPAQGPILDVLAQIHLAQDRRFRALTTASQAIQFDPDLLSAYVTVGRANALLGEPEKGIRSLDEALRREPRYFPAWYYRARILFEIGALRDAETSLTEALRINPSSKEAVQLRIRLVKRSGRLATANWLIETALKTWPEDPDLLLELLDLYRQRRDWASAGQVLERMLKLGPLAPEPKLAQVQLFYAQGQTRAYLTGLQELLTSYPRYAPGWVVQAKSALGADRPEEAIPALSRAVDLDPALVDARFWLAVAYYQSGEALQGNAALAEAARQAPDYPPLRLLRIRRALVDARLESAGQMLDAFLRDFPYDIEAILLKSEWHILSGDLSSAATLLAMVPPVGDDAVLQFSRARLAYLQGQYRTVLAYTQPASKEAGMTWRQAYLRGASLARLGQHREALALLQPFLRLPETDGRMHRLFGDIQQLAGERRAAERTYLDGLALFPRKLILLDALSRLAIELNNWNQAKEMLERGLEVESEYKALFAERLNTVYRNLNNAQGIKSSREKYLEAADPVLKESLHPADRGVLFGMTLPPLEPVFRAPPVSRIPPAPVPPVPPQVNPPRAGAAIGEAPSAGAAQTPAGAAGPR